MPVVQRIRCQAQRYSGSPFLSSLVFVRLTGVKWIRPGNHSPRLCLAWRAKRFILRGLMAESFQHLLKATSRSFYLTLRVLPARVRPQIGQGSGARRSCRFNVRLTMRPNFLE